MPSWYANFRIPILLLQTLIGVQLFAYTFEWKVSKVKHIIYILLGMLICYLSRYVFGYTSADLVNRIFPSIVVYFSTILITFVSRQASFYTCLFITSSGYIAQDIAGSIKTILKINPHILALAQNDFGILFVDLICYGGSFIALFYIFRSVTFQQNENFDNRIKAIFSFFVLLLCISMARLTQENYTRNVISCFSESVYAIICDFLILLLQFGTMEGAKLKQNVQTMHSVLCQQTEQNKLQKESSYLVSEKYHDLKSLIHTNHISFSKQEINALQHNIGTYDTFIQTGNNILDVLLIEKRKICHELNIPLTCFLDGNDFHFMDELDLYSLFSNILNNAIEAVAQVPTDKRFIIITLERQSNYLFLHSENAFDGTLHFEKGLPKTQKDTQHHGFGLKSIKKIAEKYDGSLSINSKNNVFYLDIVLDSQSS